MIFNQNLWLRRKDVIEAGSLAVGSSVYLRENGRGAEYLVVNQGIPSGSSLYDSSCDGTWLMRKDVYENRQMDDANLDNYTTSDMHAYLNGTFLNLFPPEIRAQIKSVKIPYTDRGNTWGGADGLTTQVFIPSAFELGWTASSPVPDATYLTEDGAALSYFGEASNSKRVAYFNSVAKKWWLRTPSNKSTGGFFTVETDGSMSYHGNNITALGVRPAFVIQKSTLFNKNPLTIIREN